MMMGAVYMAAPVAWGGSGRQRAAMWVMLPGSSCGCPGLALAIVGVKGWCPYFCQLDPVTPQKACKKMQKIGSSGIIVPAQ